MKWSKHWKGDDPMGRVAVEVVVTNNRDLRLAEAGALAADKVRRLQLTGYVDTGATQLVLPADAVQRLGLSAAGEVTIRYADRRSATRSLVEDARVDLLGRHGTYRAVVEPDRTTALVGAIVLEDLDLLVDCANQQLVPRDPNRPVYEIE